MEVESFALQDESAYAVLIAARKYSSYNDMHNDYSLGSEPLLVWPATACCVVIDLSLFFRFMLVS